MNFLYALIASVLLSLLSLIGGISLLLNDTLLKKILIVLVAFAAGGLLGGAFLHIIPEAMGYLKDPITLFFYVIIGYIIFFFMENYLYWYHCHNTKCETHMFTYLNIVGDIIHNFSDGLIMGTIFAINVSLGITTTLAISFHEIPHELGNFMVLIYGGFGKTKALFFNFLSSLFAVSGTVVGFYFANKVQGFASFLLPVAAGGFIYIASCDLIPELHREKNLSKTFVTTLALLAGIILMYVLKIWG